MGSACSKVQKLLKKLVAGLPAAGRELHWHHLDGGLAQGPFLASVVCPKLDGNGVFVLCFLRLQTWDVSRLPLRGKSLFGEGRGGGPTAACSTGA